jgi:hypothetical protein
MFILTSLDVKSTVFWDVILYILEEHSASIFRVKELAKQQPSQARLPACFVLGLPFHLQDGSILFLQNID